MENGYQQHKELMAAGFDEYCFRIYPELSTVYKLVNEKIGDIPIEIESRLEELSVHIARTRDILATMDAFLTIAEYKKLSTKTEGITEIERKLKYKYDCAEERAIRDKVNGLVKALDKRISVLQSRLKSAREAKQRGA